MYQRLARIHQLTGDVQTPRRHTSLVLALAVVGLQHNTAGQPRIG